MGTLFFVGKRENFFRPLARTDRECCAAVLRSLYERIHGPNADYSEVLTREVVLTIVFEVLTVPEFRLSALSDGGATSAEDERLYAGDLLRSLKEHGWLEDYKDPIDLKPTLKLTRAGKEFGEVLSNLDNSRAKTRQRNMRSTKKALAAFLVNQDVDELLDGYDFATRVVQDLQEDIEYFRTLIQSLTREALEQNVAWGEFNEFIETRFAREYAVRLVADSAERHRGHLMEQLEFIRALPDETRHVVDAALRQRATWIEEQSQGGSPMFWICTRIDNMVDAACDLKLPMLRSEMHNYIRRFTSLLRQALSLDYSAESALGRSMELLKGAPPEDRNDFLDALAQRMGSAEIRLPGAAVRWTVKDRTLDHPEQSALVISDESRLEAAMRRAEAEAFAFSDRDVLSRLAPLMRGGSIRLDALPFESAQDVVVALHAVGAARSAEGKQFIRARKLDSRFETAFFAADNFELSVHHEDDVIKIDPQNT